MVPLFQHLFCHYIRGTYIRDTGDFLAKLKAAGDVLKELI